MGTFLPDYKQYLSPEEFKRKYAGIAFKSKEQQLQRTKLQKIWNRFLTTERHYFFERNFHLDLATIERVGIDKFIYTMGWTRSSDIPGWRQHKVRVGTCCHCEDQFLPLMFQTNFGLCNNCRPLYSAKAIRNFMMKQLHQAERYQHAHRDLMMDFFITFYKSADFRKLFLSEDPFAKQHEEKDIEAPDWYKEEASQPISISAQFETGAVRTT